jgi:hypothetical protein
VSSNIPLEHSTTESAAKAIAEAKEKEKRDSLILFAKQVGHQFRLPFYQLAGLHDANDGRVPTVESENVELASGGQGQIRKRGVEKVGMTVCMQTGEVVDVLAGKGGGSECIDPKLLSARGGASNGLFSVGIECSSAYGEQASPFPESNTWRPARATVSSFHQVKSHSFDTFSSPLVLGSPTTLRY